MLDLTIRLIVSLLALIMTGYLVTEGRLPFGLAGVVILGSRHREFRALAYEYRPGRTYYRLTITRADEIRR
jgi:hypothetical protein